MCLAVYVASDVELPLITWDDADRRFYVSELSSREQEVKKQFSLPRVHYAGTRPGCGCGCFKSPGRAGGVRGCANHLSGSGALLLKRR